MTRIVATAMLVLATALSAASAQTSGSQQGSPMTPVSPDVLQDLAPTGKLRAAINLGNVVLAQKDPATGRLKGITVDLAHELGRRLHAEVELVPFDAAGKVFEAVKSGNLDVMFLAIEPVRANEISFTAPYVIIEGVYMVPQDSKITRVEDVDRDGMRIGVNKNSAYDLFLTRTLKHATLVRSDDGIDAVRERQARCRRRREAAAGRIREQESGACACWTAASWKSARPWARRRDAATPGAAISRRSSRR